MKGGKKHEKFEERNWKERRYKEEKKKWRITIEKKE